MEQNSTKSNDTLLNNAQALQAAITQSDVEYYLRFEQYLQQAYFDPNLNLSFVRYYSPAEKWYCYNPQIGVYLDTTEQEIKKIFYEWADLCGEKTSNQKMAHALDRMKAYLEYKGLWDDGKFNGCEHIINVRNGLLDTLTLQLIPHTPEYMSRNQIPRWYIPDVKKIPSPLKKVLSSTPDRDNLLKFMVATVKNRHEDEVFLMLYGQKHSGKSTTLQIFELIMGRENISKSSLFKLKGAFGFDQCFDKLINIYPDLPIAPLDSHTIGILKTMTGEDGDLEIELKGITKFKYPIVIFFAFGTNQLPSFVKGASMEMESLMRRACLIHYPKTQVHEPEFKKLMRDPGILDLIFSYLMHLPYIPLYLPQELDAWIDKNMEKWLDDSAPVMRAIKSLYFYCDIPSNGKGDPYSIPIHSVIEEVREILQEEGFVIGDLQADITAALKSMRIHRNSARGAKASYLKMMRLDDPDADKMKKLMVDVEKKEILNPNAKKGQMILDTITESIQNSTPKEEKSHEENEKPSENPGDEDISFLLRPGRLI